MLPLLSPEPQGGGQQADHKKYLSGAVLLRSASVLLDPLPGIPLPVASLTTEVRRKGIREDCIPAANRRGNHRTALKMQGFQAQVRPIRTEKSRFPCMRLRFPRKRGSRSSPLKSMLALRQAVQLRSCTRRPPGPSTYPACQSCRRCRCWLSSRCCCP